MRLFVAINFPNEIKNSLNSFIKDLKVLPSDAKWVNSENLHLTVQFLGDVPEDKAVSTVEALKRSVKGVSPFYLTLGGVGVFPSKDRPRVFWAGVHGETTALLELHRRVQKELGRLGFTPDQKRFSPHLTLARLRSPQGFVAVFDRAEKLARGKEFGRAKVMSVDLMLSELSPRGPRYTVMAGIKLRNG
ncbi:RNA 2',3'-cyclic phosphodiesterase [Pelotomaculum propionicicum]|uniref:RNA 2',3'-cyclic phosphodiesterase n=1 Tax=Pelotomaculum propionicicum TaxID=258475 RepID=A0A4Y7RRC3_9FIRM|nr:RNA 2',3'-cyclic phosphodiesterase [Pelotomaculum propionicicum]NLI12816.1 RNA 2',3'-cyclic phosphodiesterase [Peptococcaceae bacterium]TEB11555.1 RNA 2',3'-cyclic phosphodiesterase [Pelotomaculum propionicicum]